MFFLGAYVPDFLGLCFARLKVIEKDHRRPGRRNVVRRLCTGDHGSPYSRVFLRIYCLLGALEAEEHPL